MQRQKLKFQSKKDDNEPILYKALESHAGLYQLSLALCESIMQNTEQ